MNSQLSYTRTKIASTHGDHSVRITDAATGKCTHVLEGHPRTPWCLAFHPSSNQIVASGCLDGEVRIWDLFGGGSEVWRCKEHTVIASLTFHPTDNLLVFAAGNSVYFWDWTKPEPFAVCSTKHDFERVRWVKFHPHGHHLYTGITNTATLQQSNSSRVSFISGRPSFVQRTRGLSNVYDNLVECFQTYQRDRVINLATAGSGPIGNTADLDTPPSPVHEEGLSFARQYARHVTETAASEAAEQDDVIPSEDQGPSSSTVPSLSGDFSWSPPPRTAAPEEAMDNSASARPVIIVSNSHERPPRPLNSSRLSAGIIGNRRTDNLYRHMFRQNNNDSASGSLTNLRRSPLSRPRSILDHSNCDGHCDVCRNYNLTVHNRRNQSSLQSRQERLESGRRYCRDRLMALRRRQNDLPTCSFNERSSIYSDNSSERLSGHNQPRFNISSSPDQPEASASGQSSVDRNMNISESANSTSSMTENYDNIRNNFVSITTRLEQEMNELDRRINDLRNSFQESIRQLQVEHGIGEASDEQSSNRDVPLNQQVTRPVITVTGCRESHDSEQSQPGNQQTRDRTHLLETALRTSVSSPRQSLPTPPVVSSNSSSRTEVSSSSSNTWQTLQRHHLHPHYSVSILDDTINRPHDAVQRAINHTIAGAFMGRGEAAVASNIVNQTYRIQYWDMIANAVPDISDEKVNIIVPHCKLHNDASCDISQDGTLLATFAPSHRGFPDDNIMAVYSLLPQTVGQCLYTKSFGPNAISVSISPRNQHVLVGLAAKRLIWVFTTNQLVGQIYKLDNANTGKTLKHVMDIMHPCDIDIRSHVSVNSARWMPTPGHGLVYGTNRGDLQICRPGSLKVSEDEERASTSSSISRRNILLDHMLGGISRTPVTVNSIATQTPAVRRSMSTQTDESDSNVCVNILLHCICMLYVSTGSHVRWNISYFSDSQQYSYSNTCCTEIYVYTD
ncbi:Activating molecule in BECN1-regulated autophagy protein 1 [Mytilus edulis]|uniref:Activating molecule in BECN1-regulated autophagy protein 1 n=1 Tax=Mytilus edulis TaxID=6550 RepID=A0A8S3QTP0_MYTED|nr:Activating molecule in BECN1-regulated autophagy protein 1 [Mytilus edulis]